MDDDIPLPAKVVTALGVLAGVVLSTWTTVIAFVGGTMPIIGWETEGGILTGILWVMFVDPLVLAVCYAATALLTIPLTLLLGTDARRRNE